MKKISARDVLEALKAVRDSMLHQNNVLNNDDFGNLNYCLNIINSGETLEFFSLDDLNEMSELLDYVSSCFIYIQESGQKSDDFEVVRNIQISIGKIRAEIMRLN